MEVLVNCYDSTMELLSKYNQGTMREVGNSYMHYDHYEGYSYYWNAMRVLLKSIL